MSAGEVTEDQCGERVASCLCGEPKGHVAQGEEVHKCSDHEVCMGEWKGSGEDVVPVVYPGGLNEEQALAKMAENEPARLSRDGSVVSRRVLKWTVRVDDEWHPIGSGTVVAVEVQDTKKPDVVQVWTDERDSDNVTVIPARAFATGQEVPDDALMIGAAMVRNANGVGSLVWNVAVAMPSARPATEPEPDPEPEE